MLETFLNHPWYFVFGALVLFVFIFGKKKEWEYEAKLFKKDGGERSVGELEIKKYHKHHPEAEFELKDIKSFYGKEVEVLLNDVRIIHFQVDLSGKKIKLLFPQEIRRKKSKNQITKFSIKTVVDPSLRIKNQDKVDIKVDEAFYLYGVFYRD